MLWIFFLEDACFLKTPNFTCLQFSDDTDYSESESAQISKHMDSLNIRSPTSITSETEEESRDGKCCLKYFFAHQDFHGLVDSLLLP